MAEQDSEEGLVVETQKSRERVIVDPSITLTRMFNALFFGVNVAAVTGHISMAYVEKYVGFWLAQTIPTISLLLCPLILLLFKRRYVLTKPAGSVMGKTYRLSRLALMERKRREPEKTWCVEPLLHACCCSRHRAAAKCHELGYPTCAVLTSGSPLGPAIKPRSLDGWTLTIHG